MVSKSFSLKLHSKILPFKKTINVDADKSISIRSLLIGAVSQNISNAKNVLESQDIFSSINCLKKLGVRIKKLKKGYYSIYGKGLGSLNLGKNEKLNFGNSGTLARLLIGILSTTPGIKVNISGDHSLNKRSMKNLIDQMTKFGASFKPINKFNFPLHLTSSDMPIGIKYIAGSSAQIKSAVILAGLNSFGNTSIIEKQKSRDHTENILSNNIGIIKVIKKAKKNINIVGRKYLKPIQIDVPNDPSSAAFFSALTLLNNDLLS